ncbi:MAG: glycosyltransferase [Calothrix sp. MO_192.B10]|nr:glycosyltransferase [Calothrix sp. MO_192.B10]
MIYFLTVNYYATTLVAKLINSLEQNNDFNYQIVIVNNSPDDHSIYQLKSELVTVLNTKKNIGFGRACNLGIEYIYHQDSEAILWIINPDAYFQGNNWGKVNTFFDSHPEVSILGTIIHTPTGKIWFAGGRFIPRTGTIVNQDFLKNNDSAYALCDWVSGCSLIINLRNFAELPVFDSAYFLYYEDFDFCQRYAQAGHLIAVTQQFGVIHRPSSITNRYVFRKIKHSTYSYLLTLEKYSKNLVFSVRLTKLILYALILIFIRPQMALGKFAGLFAYWHNHF